MSDELYPPFERTVITRIYRLKPLCIAEQVPISFQISYVLMFQPRKCKSPNLKHTFVNKKHPVFYL
jgi:hypothetical protein